MDALSFKTRVLASMRPRLSAGDRNQTTPQQALALAASMRPRLSAGDRAGAGGGTGNTTQSFNEAPAERRGSGAWTR